MLKVQMPANDWEWYILGQVDQRFDQLQHPLKEEETSWKRGFMTAPRCYTYRDGAVIISQLQKMGTLLDLVNLTKNADKSIIEPIAIYLTAELLGLMELLHSVNIVHADFKPDNFLMRHTPSTSTSPSLQLIDFGKAIDLKLEAVEEVKAKQNIVDRFETPAGDDAGQKMDVEKNEPESEKSEPKTDKIESESETPEPKSNKSEPLSGLTKKTEIGVKNEQDETGQTGKHHLDYFGIAGGFNIFFFIIFFLSNFSPHSFSYFIVLLVKIYQRSTFFVAKDGLLCWFCVH